MQIMHTFLTYKEKATVLRVLRRNRLGELSPRLTFEYKSLRKYDSSLTLLQDLGYKN